MKPYLIVNPIQRPYWIAAITLFILFACKKGGEPASSSKAQHEFTNLPDSTDSRLLQYTDSLLVREVVKPWMDSVLINIGTPGWRYASFGVQNGKPAAMVPLIDHTSKNVAGILVMVHGNDGFCFRIIDSRKPERYGFDNGKNYVNARAIFFAADLFNQRAFPDKQPATMTDPCMMTRNERKRLENARQAGYDGQFSLRAMPYALSITCYTTVACTGDGNGNCIGNYVTTTECVYNYIWINDWSGGGGYGDPDGGSGGGHGSGGGGSSPGQPMPGPCGAPGNNPNGGPLAILPPSKPIENIKEYVSCFSRTHEAKITLYADQPVSGTDEVMDLKEKVGHSYITIEQTIGNVIVRRTLGYHPYQGVSPMFGKETQHQMGDDSNEEYDVKLDVYVSGAAFSKVMDIVENPQPTYHIENYNCTNFVLDVSDACGLKIPRTKGWWVVGSGLNPGSFGQDLRKQDGAIAGQNRSPENIGSCN